jgi:hypothetical protein
LGDKVSELMSGGREPKDHFAVAQVALYIFAVLQAVAALMTAFGAIPLGLSPQASSVQRAAVTIGAIINILSFLIGYVLLARCLTRCSTLVWRIALAVFMTNLGMSALTLAAQPDPHPVLTGSLSIAGAISMWNGRKAIHKPCTEASRY